MTLLVRPKLSVAGLAFQTVPPTHPPLLGADCRGFGTPPEGLQWGQIEAVVAPGLDLLCMHSARKRWAVEFSLGSYNDDHHADAYCYECFLIFDGRTEWKLFGACQSHQA